MVIMLFQAWNDYGEKDIIFIYYKRCARFEADIRKVPIYDSTLFFMANIIYVMLFFEKQIGT